LFELDLVRKTMPTASSFGCVDDLEH
jgi:hypothetical protein